jgi:hypothetical protein
VAAMKITAVLTILLVLPIGCATLAERSRMEKFGLISESFERALRTSDYTTAAKYLDPSAGDSRPDLIHLRNFKIADYKVTRVHVSEDKQKITQDVELQYFRLNGTILHSTRYPQTWRFLPEKEIWLLQTGLPDFGPHPPLPRRR